MALYRRLDRRDAPWAMAEDEEEKPAAPEPAKTAPTNKLYEWGAAVAIMVLLAGILWVFLNFLRSASL